MRGVHDARDEPSEGAVADAARHAQGDRQDGTHHQQEVQRDSGVLLLSVHGKMLSNF